LVVGDVVDLQLRRYWRCAATDRFRRQRR
jgi:hypothetical protein